MITNVHRLPGLVLSDMEFVVPLDHAAPAGEKITVFARAAVAPGKEDANLPWLVFFQGGPGFPAPRPEGSSGWLGRALQDFRVLLLDDRGTGRSTPVTPQTLAWLSSPQAQAKYLTHFRADAIVQDAELIRRELIGAEGRWSVLGQSFGGFCVTHYLSAAPAGVEGSAYHRWPAASGPAGRRCLQSHLSRLCCKRTGHTTRAIRKTKRWRTRSWPTWRPTRCGCRAAVR